MRMRQTHKRTWTHTRGDGQAKTGEEERERERDEEKKDEDEDGKEDERNELNKLKLARSSAQVPWCLRHRRLRLSVLKPEEERPQKSNKHKVETR